MLNRHVYLSSASSRSLRILALRAKQPNDCLSRSALPVVVSHQSPYHQSTSCTPPPLEVSASSLTHSDLAVRSSRLPPDSLPSNDTTNTPKNDSNPHNQPNHISDQEWEIRTGRAIHVIQETLPDFFEVGLVTSVNKVTGLPQRPHSVSPIPIHIPIPIPLPSAAAEFLEGHMVREDEEPIYSDDVRLSYTPPVVLPPPLPRTFHIDGLQMYVASSSFIRHTMSALYTDLKVQNVKMTIDTPTPSRSPAPPAPLNEKRGEGEVGVGVGVGAGRREKSVILRQVVTGLARVSGKRGEWVIESTYTFSPLTGLIYKHTINSIHPAPHRAVYESLRVGLSRFNFEWRGGGQGTGAASGAGGA